VRNVATGQRDRCGVADPYWAPVVAGTRTDTDRHSDDNRLTTAP